MSLTDIARVLGKLYFQAPNGLIIMLIVWRECAIGQKQY